MFRQWGKIQHSQVFDSLIHSLIVRCVTIWTNVHVILDLLAATAAFEVKYQILLV